MSDCFDQQISFGWKLRIEFLFLNTKELWFEGRYSFFRIGVDRSYWDGRLL